MLESPLHEHHLLRYEVEELAEPFREYERTAVVSFFDENNKKVTVQKYGIITGDDIFKKIDEGEALNLNHAYVKNFSLTNYRTNKGFDDHVYIHLKNFSAKKSFFDCDITSDFSYAEFGGAKISFESAIFGNGNTNFFNANFSHCDVSFKKAKFGSGSTSFKSVKFGDGGITFNNTNFGTGNLSFVDADFSNGNVDFKNTYFGDGHVDFKFARFASGDISFERASFGKGKKDFKNVEFGGGKIDFRRVNFNDGDVSFEGVEFGNGKVSFRSTVFGYGHKSFHLADFAHGEAQFDYADFGSGEITFNKATVAAISFTGCHLNCYTDLRFGQCTLIDLSNTVVRDILDVKPENEKVIIQEMNLVGMRILGRIFIDWRGNDVYDLIYNQQKTSLFQKAEQFRILKENFRNNGQYDDEDESYVEFKRCEAKAKGIEEPKLKGKGYLAAGINYYFQKYLFDHVGRYATAPTRVLMNVVVTVIVYGLLYFVCTNYFPGFGTVNTTLPDTMNESGSFLNCMYYSAITFFTIGYGDYFAGGYLKLLAVMEGFSGVFLMSYFTVAFVRKILR
ncbi:MAG: two pore domain potassium channel family protein [Bacteroidetes bacterium]|nr:two pore domain potassium channel family protein [Bacteroidota bacterium]